MSFHIITISRELSEQYQPSNVTASAAWYHKYNFNLQLNNVLTVGVIARESLAPTTNAAHTVTTTATRTTYHRCTQSHWHCHWR